MDLILWRHAEAHDPHEGEHDLTRPLTSRGEKHAARMADWLDQQLPEGVRILCSPAVRAEQTAAARARELDALRDEQKRRSWREMAIPQSEICLIAAVLLLATGIAVTLLTKDWTDPRQQQRVAVRRGACRLHAGADLGFGLQLDVTQLGAQPLGGGVAPGHRARRQCARHTFGVHQGKHQHLARDMVLRNAGNQPIGIIL